MDLKQMLNLLWLLIFGVIAIIVFFRWFERQNVWQPRKELVSDPSMIGLDYEDVWFQSLDGVQLHGWYIPADNSRACVLFCHGNGGNISHRLESIRQIHGLQLDIFIFDYRGYGKSAGVLSEQGTIQDAQAAYQWLRDKLPDKPVVIFGRSLGASIATHLAKKVDAKGLVCESAFISIVSMGKRLFPYLPVAWLTTIRYNTYEAIKQVNMPILLIHSEEDDLIPIDHGRTLFDIANDPKRFALIQGGHNDGFLVSEADYLNAWQSFLDELIYEEVFTVEEERVYHAN